MNCDLVRDRLTAGEPVTVELRGHLAGCPPCAGFARRLAEASRLLGASASIEPDPAFSARVVAALPQGPALLGWAALRLIPATLALALALAGWAFWTTPAPADLVETSATEDPLLWAAGYADETGGEG